MQERAKNTRKAILQAAVKLFADRGFSGTSIEDIATKAKANKQRIYYYFGPKKKLFEAALQSVFEKAGVFSRQTVGFIRNDMEHMTAILLQGFFRIHENNPVFWRMLAWANLEPEIDINCLNNARAWENAELRELFRQNQAAGIVREVSFDSYLFTLLAAAYFYHSNRATLSHTVGAALFEKNVAGKLIGELENLFRK